MENENNATCEQSTCDHPAAQDDVVSDLAALTDGFLDTDLEFLNEILSEEQEAAHSITNAHDDLF